MLWPGRVSHGLPQAQRTHRAFPVGVVATHVGRADSGHLADLPKSDAGEATLAKQRQRGPQDALARRLLRCPTRRQRCGPNRRAHPRRCQ